MGNCYGCGKSGHIKRDYTMIKAKGRENAQEEDSAPNPGAPKKNHFYAHKSRGDQESSLDVVTGMLKLFSFDVYALLDLGATLSFVAPLVALKFEILPGIFDEPFSVSTLMGDSVVCKRVYKCYPISYPNRVTLIELVMLDFHVILGIDWLHACFASIGCRTRIVKF